VKALIRKVIIALLVGAMLAAAAGVMVVSAAIALFGVLKDYLGGPGANAVVAVAAAVLSLALALILERWILKPPGAGRGKAPEDDGLMSRLASMAQERPIVAVGALIGGVVLAIRNPALTAIVVKAFLDPKSRPSKKKA
jgi:hypothetical protein